MAYMKSIPGTPDWIKSKGGKNDVPVTSVTVTEEGKTTSIEVKLDNK